MHTEAARVGKSRVRGVFVERLAAVEDLRGKLVAGEIDAFLPFKVKRFFVVHGVPGREVRGQHAHKVCHQFLVCIRGSCRVIADDGSRRQEFLLDDPATGVYVPPKVWSVQYDYSADAALLVFASHAYDAGRLRAGLRRVPAARRRARAEVNSPVLPARKVTDDDERRSEGRTAGHRRLPVRRRPLRGHGRAARRDRCHCAMCRKTHGHVGAYTAAPKSASRSPKRAGSSGTHRRTHARRGFCAECGGSLFFDPVRKDTMSIAAGTLDPPTGLATVVQIHVASAGDYYRIDDAHPAAAGLSSAAGAAQSLFA